MEMFGVYPVIETKDEKSLNKKEPDFNVYLKNGTFKILCYDRNVISDVLSWSSKTNISPVC